VKFRRNIPTLSEGIIPKISAASGRGYSDGPPNLEDIEAAPHPFPS